MQIPDLYIIITATLRLIVIHTKLFALRHPKETGLALYAVFQAGSLFTIYRVLTGNYSNLTLLALVQTAAALPMLLFFWYFYVRNHTNSLK